MNHSNDEVKAVLSMTSATVGRDLLQALVQEIKLLPSVWVKLPKAKQDDVIDRLRSRVEANVKMAVHLIASEGRSVIVGECKKVNIADEVKSEFVVSRKDHKAFHDLCDAQGKACLLVVAEANQHTQGMEEICGEADQRAMDLGHEYDPNSDGKGMDGNSGDNDHVIDAEVKAIAHRPLDSELRQAHADGYKAASEGKPKFDCPVMKGELCIEWIKGWKAWHAEHGTGQGSENDSLGGEAA